jgi:multidrug resistance efflux pump
MASIRELGARLRSARALLDTRTILFKKGEISRVVVQQTQGEVEILKARIDSLQDALQEERELLEAQLEAKKAAVRGVERQLEHVGKQLEHVKGLARSNVVGQQTVDESENKVVTMEAERDVKRAELMEVEIRLKQLGRRLDLIEQVRSQAKESAPVPANSTEPPPPSPRSR